MQPDSSPETRQPAAFLWLYALAWAGGAVAYVPFLTILLPARVESMAGDHVRWLAYMTFCGAVAASVGGILFGWASDRSGVRRPWIATGLVLTIVLLMCVPLAKRPEDLLAIIVVWQLALNMMLAPLAAWAADHVPRRQLGSLGGLLAFSPALGSVAGALVTIPDLVSFDRRLALVALLVACCVLPGLLLARPRSSHADFAGHEPDQPGSPGRPTFGTAASMWLARFLIQISEAALFAYLYYYIRSIDPTRDASSVARLFGVVVSLSVPVALGVGRWSDLKGRPIAPLIACALFAASALGAMALARSPTQAIAGYVAFGLSTTVFLSLHSAQTFRVLRHSVRRGRDLGLFNLTNTAPSLIMPWLTVAIVPEFGFPRLFALLAVLALAAATILTLVAGRLRHA